MTSDHDDATKRRRLDPDLIAVLLLSAAVACSALGGFVVGVAAGFYSLAGALLVAAVLIGFD